MAWWRFAPDSRLTGTQRGQVEVARECPGACGGRMQRLAERQFAMPYRWMVIGYRCSMCGSVYIDTRVSV